jgi:Pyridoxamine 5'-phosphate oxidase
MATADHEGPGPLTWSEVADRLDRAPAAWVHTTGPDGSPHAAPVWLAVVDERLYIYTARTTVKAVDLAGDARAVVHLGSAADVLIVRGTFVDLGAPPGRPDVVAAFAAKYTGPEEQPFLPGTNPVFDVLYRLDPTAAVAWRLPDTEASTRRWRPGG